MNRTTYDGEIRPSAEELDGGRFWTIQEIREAMGNGVLTPNFESEFKRCFGKALLGENCLADVDARFAEAMTEYDA